MKRLIDKKNLAPVMILMLAILLPVFISNNYYVVIFNQILIYSIIVFGLNFITGLTGQTNLGTAGIMALGGYVSAILCTKCGWSPWFSTLLAVFAGYFIGVLLGYPSLKLKGVYLALTTLAFNEVVRLLSTNLTGLTGGTQGIKNIPRYSLFGFELDTNRKYYYFVLVIAVLMFLVSVRIVHSKWGREFKAVRDNIDALPSLGLDVKKIKIRAFTLAAVYGAFGGALYVHFNMYMNSSTYTVDLSIKMLIMLLFGGIGNVVGNVFGTAVVIFLPEALRFLGDYYQVVFYAIALGCSLFFPNGIISMFQGIGRFFRNRVQKKQAEGGAQHE